MPDMKTENLTEDQIEELLLHKVANLERHMESLQLQLDDLDEQLDRAKLALDAYQDRHKIKKVVPEVINVTKPNGKPTLSDKAEQIFLKLNKPLTAPELTKAINEFFPGKKKLESKTFSASWSGIYRDAQKPFQRMVFPNNPNESKYYYGLKTWFDNNKLKNEYVNRIESNKLPDIHKELFGP